MTREELIERVNKFQGANREFSQELPPIVEALCDEIDEAGVEVVDSLTSNARDKALSANMGKELKIQVDEKIALPEVSGEAGQFLGVDAEGNPEWQPVSSTGEPADAEMSPTSTNAVQNKVITEELDKCAKKDGYYDSLTAGFATNLVDTKGTGTEQEFIRRTSCGDESIADDGTGVIQEIKGKTIAWNQLSSVINYTNAQYDTRAALDLRAQWVGVGGLVRNDALDSTLGPHSFLVTAPASSSQVVFKHNGQIQDLEIFTHGTTAGHKYVLFYNVIKVDPTVVGGVEVDGVQFHDLTLLGLGDLTADQFKARYPKFDYAYNAGVLKSNDAAALLTDGFNQWDEEWESGIWNSSGEKDNATAIRSVSKFPCFPNTTYYCKCGPEFTLGIIFRFFDANGAIIGSADVKNAAFTTPNNAVLFALCSFSSDNVTTYNHDICINLSWSSYRNGEYEPYWRRALALRLSELTGIPEGGTEADRVTMFPNGAGGVGTSYDSIVEGKGNKRRVRVNLGDLEWTYTSGNNSRMEAAISDAKKPSSEYVVATLICPKYLPASINAIYNHTADKVAGVQQLSGALWIYDSAYTDAATFKAAMDGVYLEYELATPIVYTDLQYADGTPFTMPKVYQVADFGTETIVQPEGATTPSAPFRAVIKYNDDFTREIVNLPENYDTTDGIDALCSALATALSSALNGTLTITRGNYSESDKRYAFTVTFTPNE